MQDDIIHQTISDDNIVAKLKTRVNPFMNLDQVLRVADLHFLQGFSYNKISKAEDMTTSRIGQVIKLYKDRVIPLLIEILNDQNGAKKTFYIHIKSHTDYPDFEASCEADNIDEAARKFAVKISDWSAQDLTTYIMEESKGGEGDARP